MNMQEKGLARILFENKLSKAEGQAYENLFTEIMNYAEPDFRKIKAWGSLGDLKSDGYIESKGKYFQVYAPEDIRTSYPNLIKKIQIDFKGLLNNWPNIKEYHFVINDKQHGVNPESEKILKQIKNDYSLEKSGFFTSDNLMTLLFSLDDDIILKVVGFLPQIDIERLNYTVLNEVIGHIMSLPLEPIIGEIKLPDWDEKIMFNNLSKQSENYLNMAASQLGSLEKFLSERTTLANELQQRMTAIYNDKRDKIAKASLSSDNIFWEIVDECSPKNESPYQQAVFVIMAKYFESCDIFEEPKKKQELNNDNAH